MILDVVQKGGRDVPKFIKEEDVTTEEALATLCSTLKVADLVDNTNVKGFVAISLYDSKPVCVMPTAGDKIFWVKKDRQAFDKNKQQLISAPFYRVNIIDGYIHIIGNVDIAGQFRGSC